MRRRSGPRRKPRPSNRTKRTDMTRVCPSNKRGFANKGDAKAFLRERPNSTLTTYRCTECGEWHLGNKVSRSIRKRLAEEGKAPPPPREES